VSGYIWGEILEKEPYKMKNITPNNSSSPGLKSSNCQVSEQLARTEKKEMKQRTKMRAKKGKGEAWKWGQRIITRNWKELN
jgi:hypothetical protein